jgi:hypothetical protein
MAVLLLLAVLVLGQTEDCIKSYAGACWLQHIVPALRRCLPPAVSCLLLICLHFPCAPARLQG